MAKLSPADHAKKWAQNFGGAGEAYKTGVNAVQVAPGQLAAQAQDRMVANFNEAVNSGRWAQNVSAVPLAAWKQAATDKGAAALATSARVAQDKVAKAEQRMGPIRDSIVASLPARGTIEQNLERSRQMALQLNAARKRG